MISPVMLRTQARSGSTYLMQLLANFPDIVTTKVHPYEIRIAQYYAASYETLSSCADHENSSRPNFFHRDKGIKWIGTNPFNNNGQAHYQKWIQNQYNPSLKEFFTQSIEDYYQNEASHQKKEKPKFFCEKVFYINRGPDTQDANVMHVLSKNCRDIYLVRDPLDILVSQIAFFRKNHNFSTEAMKNVVKNLAKHMNKMVEDYKNIEIINKRFSITAVKQAVKKIGGYENKPYVIYYEELVNSPSETLSKLSEYLQLSYDENLIETIIDKASQATEKKHITSKSSFESIKRWEKELSPEIISFAKNEMNEYIKTFNYSY